ncbi:MAG TPA: FkbM family methyltransferase [Acidobacteriaceae bacterium]|nr:FkbM family methyltransferase [Acidobacteriaceae bacterium]
MEFPHSALATFPDCSADSLEATLRELLSEPVSSVKSREKNELDRLLADRDGRCVIFGAGNMGRRAVAALQSAGVQPVCVSDNNPELWGTLLNRVPILPPEETAERFGRDAHFFIAIRNEHHWYRETCDQLTQLGCTNVSSGEPIAWRFPCQFPALLAYDLPHKLYQQADRVLLAENLWADDASRTEYFSQIRLRALGDAYGLPQPQDTESYILDDIFDVVADDIILDCGAFDGDTIRGLLQRKTTFGRIEAVEADSHSFARLVKYVASLTPELQKTIGLHHCAVGSHRGTVRFEDTGQDGSKVSALGDTVVDMVPIDVMFASKRVSMIKMDIEGGEYDALLGAANVVGRDRPILAICVYHSQEDLWRLPLLMHAMCPEHRLYLRSHGGDGIQTVAYAIPPERIRGVSTES